MRVSALGKRGKLGNTCGEQDEDHGADVYASVTPKQNRNKSEMEFSMNPHPCFGIMY